MGGVTLEQLNVPVGRRIDQVRDVPRTIAALRPGTNVTLTNPGGIGTVAVTADGGDSWTQAALEAPVGREQVEIVSKRFKGVPLLYNMAASGKTGDCCGSDDNPAIGLRFDRFTTERPASRLILRGFAK